MARVVNRAFGIGRLRRTQLQQRIQEQQVLLALQDTSDNTIDIGLLETDVSALDLTVTTLSSDVSSLDSRVTALEP
jgi:hypothetical protein